MTDLPTLGRLADVPVREAFAHEAHVLTPWLAANLDRISDAIGMPLEDADTEVAVEGFAADILAHDPANGRKVLIENQLEASDHTHLGQIMTYLAGLEANVVVWIAPAFREPHLAAIRWLNEHTVEPFAFFALRLRVVRIGESEPAPLFELIEQPNGWERQLQKRTREREGLSEVGEQRRAFWTRLAERHPDLGTQRAATSSVWVPLAGNLILVLFKSVDQVGMFIRGQRGEDRDAAMRRLGPYLIGLATALDVDPSTFGTNHTHAIDTLDPANWDEATDWLAGEAQRFQAAFRDAIGSETMEAAQ